MGEDIQGFVNLTPHTVTVLTDHGSVDFPSRGQARLVEESYDEDVIDGWLPSRRIRYGRIEGLPEPEPGVFYIVSALVGPVAASMGRRDCVAPDTGRAIRKDGAIVGVPGIVRY